MRRVVCFVVACAVLSGLALWAVSAIGSEPVAVVAVPAPAPIVAPVPVPVPQPVVTGYVLVPGVGVYWAWPPRYVVRTPYPPVVIVEPRSHDREVIKHKEGMFGQRGYREREHHSH